MAKITATVKKQRITAIMGNQKAVQIAANYINVMMSGSILNGIAKNMTSHNRRTLDEIKTKEYK